MSEQELIQSIRNDPRGWLGEVDRLRARVIELETARIQLTAERNNLRDSVRDVMKQRDDAEHESDVLRTRMLDLESAQRPPLGYVVVAPAGSIWMDCLTDRATAERDLAELTEANPQPGWRVVELREAQS